MKDEVKEATIPLVKAMKHVCDRLFFTLMLSFFIMSGFVGVSSTVVDDMTHEFIAEIAANFLCVILFTFGVVKFLHLNVKLNIFITDLILNALDKRKAKKKGIPQSLGDRLELHDDDNPFIDLRYHQTDSDTHLLSIGHNQPSVF